MEFRTHTCGELRESNIGQNVKLSGWLSGTRDLGAVIFFVLRDFYGSTQAVATTEEMKALVRSIPRESTVSVEGKVIRRSSPNPDMPTGMIEIEPEKVEVLGRCYEQLIVAPVTSKMRRDGLARTTVWLPEGTWTDFFTGETFEGERLMTVKTPAERIPVYAKEGAIIPMLAEREGNSQAFDNLEVRVFRGDGSYTMYDETGSISFTTETNGNVTRFSIKPSSDCKTETIKVVFVSLKRARFSVPEYVSATENSVTVPCKELTVLAEAIPSGKEQDEAQTPGFVEE